MRTLYGASKAERLTVRALFIPKGARLVPGPAGGAAYTYDGARQGVPVFYAIAFWGSSAKSLWHHSYRTAAQRDAAIVEFHRGLIASTARKQTAKAEKSAWTNPLKVGDILHTSWGYDQTNVEFYVVTRVSGRATWIREIAQDSEATGYMQTKCWPAMPIRMVGEETKHIAQPSGKQSVYLKIHESAHAWPEDGTTHYSSSYA